MGDIFVDFIRINRNNQMQDKNHCKHLKWIVAVRRKKRKIT